MVAQPLPEGSAPVEPVLGVLRDRARILALTGAGCSTDSGIPDYRNADGTWKHRRPTTFQRFVTRESVRRRYWAGSLLGWRRIADARPNGAHRALTALESDGRALGVVTQNVDGLHGRAGSRTVVDLHGRLDRVVCLSCRARFPRDPFQAELARRNPGWSVESSGVRPDGDAGVGEEAASRFEVPPCPFCRGVLKPDVVFFGEAVPPSRVARAFELLDAADALLVVGSSLMVWSGYRFVVCARERGIPIVAVNLGLTRADAELTCKVEARCAELLPRLVRGLRAVGRDGSAGAPLVPDGLPAAGGVDPIESGVP